MTNDQKARALLAEAVGVPLTSLPSDPTIATYQSWDSIAHMRLVLAIENCNGAQLETAEILSLTTIQAIVDALK